MKSIFLFAALTCALATAERPIDVWAVKLAEGVDADAVAREHGMRVEGARLPGGFVKFVLDERRTRSATRSADQLETHSHVHVAERQVVRKRYHRGGVSGLIGDPLFARQWHLHGTPTSVKPQSLWHDGVDGTGITVAVVDDGIDYNHVDVRNKFVAAGSYDFNDGDADVMPVFGDGHGTSAAGCVAAEANDKCGVGVAPMASLAGIRLLAADTTDMQEGEAESFGIQLNDIYSNSWGPVDDGRRLEGPGSVLEAAFRQGVTEGRGGLGTVYAWASGNGRAQKDSCNYDGYANRRETIPVGGIDQNGILVPYSEGCAALYAVVPTSGGSAGGITTIAMGNRCTSAFGGTSAACPIFAGVLALVLQARPELTWRDVQHVVVKSAIKTDPRYHDWIVNQGGFHHSHDYGFGRIDANRTVSFARSHQLVPPAKTYSSLRVSDSSPIPDSAGDSLTISHTVANSGITYVEHVDLTLELTHQHRGELSIKLVSAQGTEAVLMEKHYDMTSGMRTTVPRGNKWRFGSVRTWGEAAEGEWKFIIEDMTPGNKFSSVQHLDAFKLDIYGF